MLVTAAGLASPFMKDIRAGATVSNGLRAGIYVH